MPLKQNEYVDVRDEVIIAASPPRRHRAFPTAVRLPNGDILVGFRVGSDHHMTHDGAFYLSRSSDNGQHWTPPKALAAYPGWDVCAVLGQYEDGVLPEDEKYLWARLMMYRWVADPPAGDDYRTYQTLWTVSRDFGHNWELPFPLYTEGFNTVNTNRGEMVLGGLNPHSYSATLMRLSDRTIMGMFTGNKELLKYKKSAELRKRGESQGALTEMPLAGFSSDELRTWEYVIVADPDEYGVGFSESDIVRLDSGRIVAVYGNNQRSRYFWRTYSDDEGRTWAPMKRLDYRGDSPSMVRLADGTLMVAFRNAPEKGTMGIGIAVSADGGESWTLLDNIRDQGGWDMGYPDLVRMRDGSFLCVFYTAAEERQIPTGLVEELSRTEPHRTVFGGRMRPRAYEELSGEIRGIALNDLTAGTRAARSDEACDPAAKVEL